MLGAQCWVMGRAICSKRWNAQRHRTRAQRNGARAMCEMHRVQKIALGRSMMPHYHPLVNEPIISTTNLSTNSFLPACLDLPPGELRQHLVPLQGPQLVTLPCIALHVACRLSDTCLTDLTTPIATRKKVQASALLCVCSSRLPTSFGISGAGPVHSRPPAQGLGM